MTTARLAAILSACVLFCSACQPGARPNHPVGYNGPTEPMADVVAAINANNNALPTLWARHYYEATIVDENKHSHFINGDGALLYRRPLGLRIVGNKAVAGTVFEIGSTDDRFWLKMVPEVDTMWWGRYANLGKPCMQDMPIRPDLVLEVLGVGTFNTDLGALPAPVMRFNNDADAYMFLWVTRLADRWVAQKEIWYDRVTKRPRLVLLFDANGRIVLRAFLEKHSPVEVAGKPRDQWPAVATSYRLFFPDTGTKMTLQLSDVVLDKNGVPSRRGISYPNEPGVSKVIQVDEACGGEE